MFNNRLNPSMESIDFQNDVFLKELGSAFEALMNVPKAQIPDSAELSLLASIIKHHANLKVNVSVENITGAYVEIPHVDKNHPFIQQHLRNYVSSSTGIQLIEDAKDAPRGGVDMRNGKVFGIFAEIPSKVVIGYDLLSKKYSDMEAASALAHEIGHLISYYLYLSHTTSTNQYLEGVSRGLAESDEPKQREMVLLSVKKAAKLSELDVETLAQCKNDRFVEIVVISNVVKQTESELGFNIYDTTTWEAQADQYVARLGGSRHLVSALEKMYRGHWNISFRSLPAYLAFEAFKLLMVISPAILVFLVAMDGNGDGRYDRPGDRFKRVRNQVMENLKDKSLSSDDVERLKADLAAIDEVLETVNDRRQFIGVVWDALSPKARKARNYTILQKELEAIAANDLFARAASLRQLKA